MQLSVDEVLRLSPDEASAKAAKGLVVPGKWASLAFSDAAVWGECKGSGAKPYQVQVDLAEPAFRCSCPSRKFPCKHGLALLLLKAQHPNNFSPADPPAWVSDWLASHKLWGQAFILYLRFNLASTNSHKRNAGIGLAFCQPAH